MSLFTFLILIVFKGTMSREKNGVLSYEVLLSALTMVHGVFLELLVLRFFIRNPVY